MRFARMGDGVVIFVQNEFRICSGAESPGIQWFIFQGLDEKLVRFFIIALSKGNACQIPVGGGESGIQFDGFGK